MPTSIQIYFLVWNLVIAVMFFFVRRAKRRPWTAPPWSFACCGLMWIARERVVAGRLCLHVLTLILSGENMLPSCFIVLLSCQVMEAHCQRKTIFSLHKTLQENVCSCVCSSWILSLFGACYKMKNYDFNKEKPDPFLELLNLVNWEAFGGQLGGLPCGDVSTAGPSSWTLSAFRRSQTRKTRWATSYWREWRCCGYAGGVDGWRFLEMASRICWKL